MLQSMSIATWSIVTKLWLNPVSWINLLQHQGYQGMITKRLCRFGSGTAELVLAFPVAGQHDFLELLDEGMQLHVPQTSFIRSQQRMMKRGAVNLYSAPCPFDPWSPRHWALVQGRRSKEYDLNLHVCLSQGVFF